MSIYLLLLFCPAVRPLSFETSNQLDEENQVVISVFFFYFIGSISLALSFLPFDHSSMHPLWTFLSSIHFFHLHLPLSPIQSILHPCLTVSIYPTCYFPPSIHQFFISTALTFCLLITSSSSFLSLISAFIVLSILHAPLQCPPPLIYPFNISFLSRPDPSVTSSQPHLLFSALILTSLVFTVKYHCPAIPLSLRPPLISTSLLW